MKKLYSFYYVFLVLFLLNSVVNQGQTTIIDNQTELDNILGCTDFYGDLRIESGQSSNTFTSIDLPNLQTVEGGLTVQYPNTNISFSNLASVEVTDISDGVIAATTVVTFIKS